MGLLGTSGAWCVSLKAASSFGVGSALGTAYLVLLSRFVESLGKEDSGGGGRGGGGGGGPARLALAGLLVLLVAKNKETLDLVPALGGFLAYQVGCLLARGVLSCAVQCSAVQGQGGVPLRGPCVKMFLPPSRVTRVDYFLSRWLFVGWWFHILQVRSLPRTTFSHDQPAYNEGGSKQ